ncbi:methyltransferase domain-containing protein [Coxiella endosymbiont of Amblyomma americanum]|uniref:methyltransferase domain-containing protein n=1 Tax=Coxiella endosymbiont of Amblyomma americanum TaxID=325775 RepID=UPI000581C0A8|nr:methyltransferase domain-containing protein [Coxiella endosymbiont of Amblyomma americanum]AJC50680.1 bioC.1 [Coxiella endosymbiont of Amblyomma americanum]AUJ58838.1 malonyl-[acyl-carrier protein] O-methyltransferase BioC [Coxiella-like endosymbiont of Amblyomma americanum]
MKQAHFFIDNRAVIKALKKTTAEAYEEGAYVLHVIADRLLERLDFIRLHPFRIVDFGTRTGYTTKALLEHYKRADIISLDSSDFLLNKARKNLLGWYQGYHFPKMLVSTYTLLPFLDQSVDLIFSNLAFQWSENLQRTLLECKRILRPGGLLLFSTVGIDTLKELRASFSGDKGSHVHFFYDMHDIGDMLTRLCFIDPVMDLEYLTIRYFSVHQLMTDLKSIGAHNASQNRSRGLMGKHQWQRMLQSYEKWRSKDHTIPVTVEVIYGHAFL